MYTALTIAGSDSSGGAGIQADIKTMTANHVYAMSAITALTAQNTTGVTDIMEVTPKFLAEQLDSIFTDIYPDAIKTGMVASGELIGTIAQKLTEYHAKNIVVDPVMVATSGARLISEDAISTLKSKLLPLATVITPNIPEDMSYEEGAMIEPLAVAVHGVKQMGDVAGMNIAVLGAGPIGNLVAQTAKGMGAAKVMITDISDLRLAKAKECGIDVCVNTKNKDFGEAMIEAFGPDKADVIYDCAGNNITMGQAIKYARKGSTIVLVAVFAGMAEVDLAVANDHELDIKSTMMYRHDDYIDGIRLVNEGKVHLKPLISKTFAFKDYLKAYQYIDDNRETTMKVIINVSEK